MFTKSLNKLLIIVLSTISSSILGAQFTIINNSSYTIITAIPLGKIGAPTVVNPGTATGLINTSEINCANNKISLYTNVIVPATPKSSSPYANSTGSLVGSFDISCFGGTNKTVTIQDAKGGFVIIVS